MVSHQEVAQSFKDAAASCGVELGRLLTFLAFMPEQHRGFIPLATDNEAIVEFARAAHRAQGAAAGEDSASTATGDGPARELLVDTAAKLHQLADQDIWELQFSDRVEKYVDPAGVVDNIFYWAETAMTAPDYGTSWHKAPAPLLVSGSVKTGKSYTLKHVVPAVVAEVLRKQGGDSRWAGMVVLHLQGDKLHNQAGATSMLRHLIHKLWSELRYGPVPVREGALEAAHDAQESPDTEDPSVLGDAILDLLKAVEVPVLVLFDEVHRLLMPIKDGRLEVNGAEYIHDQFFKRLVNSSPTIMWGFTGVYMSDTWIDGSATIPGARTVNLPATYSTQHMNLAWELLKGHDPETPLDPRLRELCAPSIARLKYLTHTWLLDTDKDAAAYVRELEFQLMYMWLRQWMLRLEALPSSQRTIVLDLSFPGLGAWIDKDLHPGLWRFMEPHLDRKGDGRYYIRTAHQRQIVRFLFNRDGTLREGEIPSDGWTGWASLDAAWNLFVLGETADYLLGPDASRRWAGKQRPAGTDEFEARMQAVADEAASTLASGRGGAVFSPQELWERQSWFQYVLWSDWNDLDRDAYMEDKQARSTHLDMLVFYLRLSRNVLAHMQPFDPEAGVKVDLSLISALPDLLRRPLYVFNESIMAGALRVLSRRTVEEAAAEIGKQLSSSSGGSEGSAADGGSSSGSMRWGAGSIVRRRSSGTGGSRSGVARGRGISATADDTSAATRLGPAAAGYGQRMPLGRTPGRHGVWGQGGPRAAPLAARPRVQQLPRSAPSTAAGAVRLRLSWCGRSGAALGRRLLLAATRREQSACLRAAGTGFRLVARPQVLNPVCQHVVGTTLCLALTGCITCW